MNKIIITAAVILLVDFGAYVFAVKNNKPVPTVVQVEKTPTITSTEVFKNKPGRVLSVVSKSDNQWELSVDLLTSNPNWKPGDDTTGGPYLNQSAKVRTLSVNASTKTYDCSTAPQGLDASNVRIDNSILINRFNKESGKVAKFDIEGNAITAMYEICLP